MDELYQRELPNFARVNQVSAALALVAIAIAIVGLFSMAVQVASRRVHEIGVRKSVGARTVRSSRCCSRSSRNPC